MTYLDYMEEHAGENMSWCRPYRDANGNGMTVNEGCVIAIYMDGVASANPTGTELEKFARTVNPDYDDYNGYDAMEIALDVMSETGCAECPWKYECEALAGEFEE